MEALYKKYQGRGFVVIGLDSEADHKAAIAYAKTAFTYPILLDAQAVSAKYGVSGIPCTFVLDSSGKIADRIVGFAPGMEKPMEAKLKALLGSQTASR